MNKLPNRKSSISPGRLNSQFKNKCETKSNPSKQRKCDTKCNKIVPNKTKSDAKRIFLSRATNTEEYLDTSKDEQYVSCLNYINSMNDLVLEFLKSTIKLTPPNLKGVPCILEKVLNFVGKNYSNSIEKHQRIIVHSCRYSPTSSSHSMGSTATCSDPNEYGNGTDSEFEKLSSDSTLNRSPKTKEEEKSIRFEDTAIQCHTKMEMELLKIVKKLTSEVNSYSDYSRKFISRLEKQEYPLKKMDKADSASASDTYEPRAKRPVKKCSKTKHNIDTRSTKCSKLKHDIDARYDHDSATRIHKESDGYDKLIKCDKGARRKKSNHRSKAETSYIDKSKYQEGYYGEKLMGRNESRERWQEKQSRRGRDLKINSNTDEEETPCSSANEMDNNPATLRAKMEKRILFETERFSKYYPDIEIRSTTNNQHNDTQPEECFNILKLSKCRKTIGPPPINRSNSSNVQRGLGLEKINPNALPRGPGNSNVLNHVGPPGFLGNLANELQQGTGDVEKEPIFNSDPSHGLEAKPQPSKTLMNMLVKVMNLHGEESEEVEEEPVLDDLLGYAQEKGFVDEGGDENGAWNSP